MALRNNNIQLAARPNGLPDPGCWRLANDAVAERRDHLRIKLEGVRTRLTDVESAASAEQRAARDQFDHLQASLDLAEKDREAGMARCAAYLRRSLRAARRSWAKNGEIDPLRSQLESAAGAYENGAHTVARDFTMAIALTNCWRRS